jgi:excisionase family DNA binding protein
MKMERLLNIREVAKILGISESTAKTWASRRIFPVVKVGRLIRISPKSLQEWIERKTELDTEGRNNIACNRQRMPIKPRQGSFLKDFR